MVINGERRLTVQKEKLTKRLEGASVRTTLRPSWKVRSFHFIAKWITGWAGALTQVLSAVPIPLDKQPVKQRNKSLL